MDVKPRGVPKTTHGKKPYRPPHLIIYGEVQRLTRTKIGNKADGAGKPATRANGPNA